MLFYRRNVLFYANIWLWRLKRNAFLLTYKNKFKFKSAYSDGLDLSAFANKDIASIIIPKEIDDVLKQKGQMLITKGNYKGNNYYTVESVSGLQKYLDIAERTLQAYEEGSREISINNFNKLMQLYIVGDISDLLIK